MPEADPGNPPVALVQSVQIVAAKARTAAKASMEIMAAAVRANSLRIMTISFPFPVRDEELGGGHHTRQQATQ
jgi:hypothetical protein